MRLEGSEPTQSFLPIRAISGLRVGIFLYRLILVWQGEKKSAGSSQAHSCGRLKFIALAEIRQCCAHFATIGNVQKSQVCVWEGCGGRGTLPFPFLSFSFFFLCVFAFLAK